MSSDEQLVEFLEQRGAIQVLLWLVDEPKRFTDLLDRVNVARATLTRRLQRGEELGLWHSPDESDGESSRYELTQYGEEIVALVDESLALRHLQSLYNMRQDFEEDRETLIQQVRENADAT